MKLLRHVFTTLKTPFNGIGDEAVNSAGFFLGSTQLLYLCCLFGQQRTAIGFEAARTSYYGDLDRLRVYVGCCGLAVGGGGC